MIDISLRQTTPTIALCGAIVFASTSKQLKPLAEWRLDEVWEHEPWGQHEEGGWSLGGGGHAMELWKSAISGLKERWYARKRGSLKPH